MKLLRNMIDTLIPQKKRGNLSRFYIIKYIYNKLMALNGVKNITVILVYDNFGDKVENEDDEVLLFENYNELGNLKHHERLKHDLKRNYFERGSILFAFAENEKIVASTWLHINFDPEGDIDLLKTENYYSGGPKFVEIEYRNQGLGKRLNRSICCYASKHGKYPTYLANQIDNIPTIKTSIKTGFRLSNLIIRLKRDEVLVL